MCGFVYCPFGDSAEVQLRLYRIMHRGLDESWAHIAPAFQGFIGHARLPIQGVSHVYDQPITRMGRVFAHVGEIYNSRVWAGPGENDSNMLARLYAEEGHEVFRAFDGMWSFIDITGLRARVFVDQLAKKPTYYDLKTGNVASEIRALVDDHLFDPLYFAHVCKWGYSPTTRTPWQNIRSIPPGTMLEIQKKNDGTVEFDLQPVLPADRAKSPVTHAVNRYNIEQAVRNRMVSSDVPVAILASGGLDSTIVLKLALQYRTQDVTVIHIENGEQRYFDMLDIPSNVRVLQLGIYSDISNDKLNEILQVNEGPVDLGSMIPQFLIAEALQKNGIHVALSGDGADELFGGYRRAHVYDSQLSDVFDELVHYHLPRIDKHNAYHQVEMRSPFLAPAVVSGALSIPYGDRTEKQFLKKTFQDIVPKEILNRKKEPLKSQAVRDGGLEWSQHLAKRYKEIIR